MAHTQTDEPNKIRTLMSVHPDGCCKIKTCGARKLRQYIYIQENRVEVNAPVCVPPLCCKESCIKDSVSVTYYDKIKFKLCCLVSFPGKFVSYKETIWWCWCCDCSCLYDACCK